MQLAPTLPVGSTTLGLALSYGAKEPVTDRCRTALVFQHASRSE